MLDAASIARLRQSATFFAENVGCPTSVFAVVSMRNPTSTYSDGTHLRQQRRIVPAPQVPRTLEHISLADSIEELKTSIRFRYRGVYLDSFSHAPLRRFAGLLLRHSSMTVSIEAHCGLEVPRNMGYSFARERAKSVRTLLVGFGVGGDRLRIKSFSNTRPLVWAFGDPEGNANRRVELYVTCDGFEVPRRRNVNEYAHPPPGVDWYLTSDDNEDEDGWYPTSDEEEE
eukprot:CAMPEP_0194335880 /NCGR_PEP_ID=MMETSP0171-20130528/71075_1 /TAXON_ID=218684 /ORGANISM="Corethron pennatum, Strain L29A3" /LENGTH=227 /DNA_ID=CAMNT_0039099133 /DNA_START=1 /DNA_END=684 /DNA_ORIENTATION=+